MENLNQINKGESMSNVVYVKQNRCLTNSKELAEAFGKRHDHVLAKIEQQLTELPERFTSPNFSVDVHTIQIGNGATRDSKVVEMTRDGFMAIAMTFTGKKAAMFRVQVIEEFNRRGEELEKRGGSDLRSGRASAASI